MKIKTLLTTSALATAGVVGTVQPVGLGRL